MLHDLILQCNPTMAYSGSIRLSHDVKQYISIGSCSFCHKPNPGNRLCFVAFDRLCHGLRMESSPRISSRLYSQIKPIPSSCNALLCRSALVPAGGCEAPLIKVATVSLSRSFNAISGRPTVLQLIPALGIIGFAVFGLEPLLRFCRSLFLQEWTDRSWKKSNSCYIMTSYFQPLLLWTAVLLICRSLDPLVQQSKTSSVIKQRLPSFIRSFSTVFTFAYCSSSFVRQAQKLCMETNGSSVERNMSIDLIGKAVYTAIWVAAVSLFMELLGLSTQKWLTAGGMGTVLLSLAGREIFTNFLSSLMIHATRPFVVNERIKTKIKGYEVSGRVEHVGWWSPTVVRGADCEAVHIPNHKLSVNVVRNLSKKTHWRIKTHLAISHLDLNNISSIIADMRKVLAKYPLVEQRKLHRRVFLEDVNPENQALMILVSCFVKTSHSEEYLRVKEAILLDLLRVVSHHGARLATPIRTIQKMYSDSDLEIDPFDSAIFTRSRAKGNHSVPFIDDGEKIAATWTPSSSVKSQDKFKSSSQAKPQNVGSDNFVQKASKSRTAPKTLSSSKGTSPSKKDEEK
ncbi:unnamed protein product [Lathyrus oleraceus]|uniref:Uncharacterized protein n=1 Tax=Pisum sativum TaxID=3888 RepID=A0A9D5ADW9_PEA|nr:mechanosensitive ion channel protein 3, chloroplastic-like [Pisum sativum]KAI5404484.1 hypothetical protein KIW84_051589 [Pisum sativum]